MRNIMTGIGLTRKPTDLSLSSSVPAASMEQPSGRFSRRSFVASYAFFVASLAVPVLTSALTVTVGMRS